MANMYLKTSARFKPYSYQEMLAPIKDYQDAYNALENEMVNLDIMAGDVASKLTHSDKDVELINLYNDFNTEMQSVIENFYTQGFNNDTKKQLAKLKTR